MKTDVVDHYRRYLISFKYLNDKVLTQQSYHLWNIAAESEIDKERMRESIIN